MVRLLPTVSRFSTFARKAKRASSPWRVGILYLSSRVPVEIIANNSHLGTMPSVSTIKNALKGFSDQKAVIIRTRGRDTSVTIEPNGRKMTKINVLIFDNVQHFARQRDLRIERENAMIIGIACTYFTFTVDLLALDYLDKRNRILTSRRSTLTIRDLLDLIDQSHIKTIGIL
jgi:hypothetical protein